MKYLSIILILLSISIFSQTQIKENQIKDNAITRNKLNADSTGKAVIKRLFAVSPLSVTSSGVDTGTGDVTVEIDTSSIYNKIDTKLNITDTTNFRTFSNNRYLLTDSITATNNYIPKISTSKKLVNSIIQDDGSNLGIGTTTNSNYRINVSGYMNLSNTNVDQETYPTINVTQEAKLHQTLGGTGVDETLSSLWIAQRFVADGNHVVRSIGARFKVSATLTNPTAVIYGYIYSDNSGNIGANISGNTYIRYGSLTSSYSLQQFGVNATLTSGTAYWVVFRLSATPTGGNILIDRTTDDTGNSYYITSANGTSWSEFDRNKSIYFRLYGRTYRGIYSFSTNYHGVYGNSTNYTGVYGTSTNSYGVYGTSTNSYGVYGTSTNSYGVYGTSTNSTGVHGTSTNYYGVSGTSTNSVGVYGTSTNYYGVYGQSLQSYAGIFYQNGTLTANNSVNTVLIRRYGTTGSYNYSGNVLQLTDNPTGTVTGSLINGNIDNTVRLDFNPRVTDGASAIAYMLDTKNNLSNAAAKLFDVRNSGTTKFSILASGQIQTASNTKVDNLNADYLDGLNSDSFATSDHNHNGTYCRWRGSGSSDPTSPISGDIYYNTVSETVLIYVTDRWIDLIP